MSPVTRNLKPKSSAGFSAVELLVVLGITALLIGVSIPKVWNALHRSGLSSAQQDLVHALRRTQSLTVQSQGDSVWSVHLLSGVGGSFIVYKGDDYAGRDTDYDETFAIPSFVTLSSTTPDSDITFAKGFGGTTDEGTVMLQWSEGGLSNTVDISSAGIIDPS